MKGPQGRRTLAQPKVVAVAAYEAANQGHYAAANACLAPEVRKDLRDAHAAVLASNRRLRQSLAKLAGRKDVASAKARRTLQNLIRANQALLAVHIGSRRFLRELWEGATRGQSLAEVRAIRQVVRGTRARVYLRLTFKDGTVVKQSEPLVLRHGRWRLG